MTFERLNLSSTARRRLLLGRLEAMWIQSARQSTRAIMMAVAAALPLMVVVCSKATLAQPTLIQPRSAEAAAPESALADRSAGKTIALIRAGEKLALRQCSLCHLVAGDPLYHPIPGQEAPNFEVIANEPGTTAQSLRRFVTTTHWDESKIQATMPNQQLIDKEPDEVVAYIMSLRRRH